MKISKLVIFAMVVAFLAHSINMFNFPYYENDEGVYLSQAWSVIHLGKLAPYTYWYDHSPVGWLFVALFLAVFRSLYLFGFSLNWARVFMLIVHLMSSMLLLKIGKKLTKSYLPGAVAVVIFSLSPLGLYFQRRLLLDNIMICWVLFAYYLLISTSSRLSRYAASGLAFGIAVLTKENAVFFLPGFWITVLFICDRHHRLVAFLIWTFIVGSLVSFYFLFALQKGELFPYGTPLVGGSSPHVSLLGSLTYQLGRVGGNSFAQNLKLWIQQDKFLIFSGITANIIFLIYALIRNRKLLGLALFGPMFWWFLVRGGITIEFYIIPLIPLMALYIGLVSAAICSGFPRLIWPFFIILTIYCVIEAQYSWAFAQGSTHGYRIFQSQQTSSQTQAIKWIQTYIPTDAIIVVDNYAWLQLHDPDNPTHLVYPNAHWYWKIDQDPAIKYDLLKNDPSRIDFIAKTPQMTGDLAGGMSPTTTAALENSRLITGFNNDGWGVEIWGTIYPRQILARSWDYYKNRFITPEGRVIDPYQNDHTTSEGQSYALLRAVILDDQLTFNRVWDWTAKNLQQDNGTFIWLFNPGETSTAADADIDMATALLMAGSKWKDETYNNEAVKIIRGIRVSEMKDYYLLPGNWAMDKSGIIMNPSYFSPAAFKMFAKADPDYDWISAVASGYTALTNCSVANLGKINSVVLPPNWCELDESGNAIQPTESGTDSTDYSYDATRVMWRIALDYYWNYDPRAKSYLEKSGQFLKSKWEKDLKILVGYTHDGQDWEKYDSSIGYAAALANFSVTNRDMAKEIYKSKIEANFFEEFKDGKAKSYWDDPENYYTQNWTWFSVALYSGILNNHPNL